MIKQKIIDEILSQCTTRYATIKASGISFNGSDSTLSSVDIVLISYNSARTLYLNKKPNCRSFDGITSHIVKDKKCVSCENNQRCTPQIMIDCDDGKFTYRFLLAYTSAQNFLLFIERCKISNRKCVNRKITISVKNRGRWGEAVFKLIK